MLSPTYYLATLFILGLVNCHPDYIDLNKLLKGVDPESVKSVPKPKFANSPNCGNNVNRLKNGPANIPEEIKKGTDDSSYKFVDDTFKGTSALYDTEFL